MHENLKDFRHAKKRSFLCEKEIKKKEKSFSEGVEKKARETADLSRISALKMDGSKRKELSIYTGYV